MPVLSPSSACSWSLVSASSWLQGSILVATILFSVSGILMRASENLGVANSRLLIRLRGIIYYAAVAQWLRASNIFRQICKSTSKWRGFESRWFYQSGFEFGKIPLLILNHLRCGSISCRLLLYWLTGSVLFSMLCVCRKHLSSQSTLLVWINCLCVGCHRPWT